MAVDADVTLQPIADFSAIYADQNDRDHAALRAAVDSGQIQVGQRVGVSPPKPHRDLAPCRRDTAGSPAGYTEHGSRRRVYVVFTPQA